VTDIARTIGQTLDLVSFNEVQAPVSQIIRGADPFVLFCDVPDASARRLIAVMRTPVWIIEDDFRSTVEYCMTARRFDVSQALRLVSHSFATLGALSDAVGARRISADPQTPVASWIDSVAAVLNLSPQHWQEAREDLLERYSAFPTLGEAFFHFVQGAAEVEHNTAALSSRSLATLTAFTKAYERHRVTDVIWPAEVMLDGAPPYRSLVAPIDLTGPARILVFGPYLHLQRGDWVATIEFNLSHCPGGNALEFDVTADGKIKSSERFLLDAAGTYRLSASFAVEEPSMPIECRCFLAEGAIAGQFEMVQIRLRRTSRSSVDECEHYEG